MTRPSSTPSRISADIAASAAAVAPYEHRTITEQINYWARVGMQIERSASVTSRSVLAVAAGRAQFSGLTVDERRAAHALIDAGIAERAASERFGAAARAAGQTTVSIDDDGYLIEIAPGGTRRRL
ncbi:MAG: ParD-like family protein [Microthrixaceae bacterium]|nr:ParD-like family protein [Microthrixaceae bacterium]